MKDYPPHPPYLPPNRSTAITNIPSTERDDDGTLREFSTGATRDTADGKPDYEGFLSPIVIKAFGDYMHKNRLQTDGKLRAADNWQKGMPADTYMSSGWRHFLDWWSEHRGFGSRDGVVDAICGLMFNAMGYLHEYLKDDPRSDGAGR